MDLMTQSLQTVSFLEAPSHPLSHMVSAPRRWLGGLLPYILYNDY